MTVDYKSTVFLPRTEFAMRANLPTREPETLARWEEMDLFGQLRAQSTGREKFILHDGPPYANGHLHMGHALNKILKDVINRSQQMLGKDADYVPGWDCHGLPIEWKIEEQYRAAGKDKDEVSIVEFRRECREFAEKWIEIQRDEFKRLGVVGDWDDPYTTMAYEAEAQIAAELLKFAESGQLYRGSKPVMWSVVEKTALAEAEVEYHDHVSTTVWVKFPVIEGASDLLGTSVVIWTTTPWTIPANRAIAFAPAIKYGLYEVTEAPADNWAKPGDRLIMADALAASVMAAARVEGHKRIGAVEPSQITLCAHPLRGVDGGQGYWDYDVPMLSADYVTEDQGTGFVHTAPGHGADDFNSFVENRALFAKVGLMEVPHTVGERGEYYDHVPLFAGKRIYDDKGKPADANEAVVQALAAAGALIARGRLTHQYPHSWRSKAPLIFRNTPQWFISMGDDAGADGLRAKALKAIEDTRFVPASGKDRLYSMIEQRPDWVISRQRAWGVPITVFVRKTDGQVLVDAEVNARILDAFRQEGADAWFADGAAARFLGEAYDSQDWEKVDDILDVWFDSGSTHSFVLEARPALEWPASLYLEGSDQHRGWFHSSLLEACGTRGRAPYETVLTHGFLLAEDGQKMSKSLGNIVSPQDVVQKLGADILRLWVVNSDYYEDVRVGPEILKQQVDLYRRLRNTLRFLLGNLADFEAAERVAPAEMPELERWVLHRLAELDTGIRKACEDFDFHAKFQALHNFCAVDLSAFYFDIRKDSLYCDRLDSPTRRACRTVLDHLYDCLTAWLAPVLCFTAEEVWLARADGAAGGREPSVHLRLFPEVPADWRDDTLAAKWQTVRALRRVVTGALEIERAEKRIGSSLQAHPVVYTDADRAGVVADLPLDDIVIASAVTVTTDPPPPGAFTLDDVPGVGVEVRPAKGDKCARCWKVLPDVDSDPDCPGVCKRCADAVAGILATAPA
ncbi:MAG: isoleucine--tRNA ligase [Alphaproteobacteria bacterium]|nr:isoleucine--tRNA ligase [Alphaproteobacteria bacterium]